MPQWTPLNASQHAAWQLRTAQDYRFAAADQVAPVLTAELQRLVSRMPLGFIAATVHEQRLTAPACPEDPARNRYTLIALQSLQAASNLFVNAEGQWLSGYVPAHYRAYPFALQPTATGERVVCLDAASDRFTTEARAEDTEPLFNPDGSPSEALAARLDFLQQCYNHRILTQRQINQLDALNLIQPWALKIKLDEQEDSQPIQGLYHIDHAALTALAPADLQALAASGALDLAYGQHYSQANLEEFTGRSRYLAQQIAAQPAALDLNLDELLADDDLFRF